MLMEGTALTRLFLAEGVFLMTAHSWRSPLFQLACCFHLFAFFLGKSLLQDVVGQIP